MNGAATVSARCTIMATVVSMKPVNPDKNGVKRRINILLMG